MSKYKILTAFLTRKAKENECEAYLDILALINELESENERLNKSDTSKEESSIEYYNLYREFKRENQTLKNRIAELEDKIEDGTLIELPCKVGDIVYQFDNGGEIYELMILHINIYKGKPYYETDAIDFDNRAIGESIFLTKAEAEARLKELQEEQK